MQLTCPQCRRVLEYATERPSFCAYCGQRLASPPSDLTAAETLATPPPSQSAQNKPLPTIRGYRLIKALGQGGMGTVYEAVEEATGRSVALKLIATEFAGSSETVDRFRQEGRLASLVTHPRCVFVLGVDDDQGRPFIVMELMPGPNLQELVKKNGPLPIDDAIAKILDVIEGLQAAHKLEVIHRDVKPSNCFLEADGRVKVGDFGLAKSLIREGNLTRTGAFVGTVYFASPEQLRGEPLDPRTDVYSVAATLYYLLTGKAPFQGSDAGSAMARIVSEPPPPMRSVRSEIPAALDRIVLRGLERNRDERWPDLESFREALLSLIPVPLTPEAMPRRILAGLIDFGLLIMVGTVFLLLRMAPALAHDSDFLDDWDIAVLDHLVLFSLSIGYFAISEWAWGRSLGKKLLRLQVAEGVNDQTPSLAVSALRALLFVGLPDLGSWANRLVSVGTWFEIAWSLLALALLASTMRPANGFRGLHEFLSGTRVLQFPWPKKKQKLISSGPWLLYFLTTRRLDHQIPNRQNFPERIGGFTMRGVLKWTPENKVLLGEDPSLGRRVFLWLRPGNEPPLDSTRRLIGRRTRLRWLGCGTQSDLQWDALLAPLGCPLPELVHNEGPLSWPEARLLLAELAEELSAAVADGTLPNILRPDLVWVQPDGRPQLADLTLVDAETLEVLPAGDALQRCWHLLREVAALAVTGRRDETAANVVAASPRQAQPIINRLFASGFQTLDEFARALRA